ncbi:hypothetical protein BJ138DRAFT_1121066 [Hygrophoropsis aurantiaca]|uniref:Uncharacterized protein n=1 Tax=Hygrophoropsis aurantiaca TaxID=72124 RepID=A0ACB7ZNN3_9AGAM|nr:hypothetical protein BJ138DRAFT_1121066 [Hygrophoropsis aurantiaca]
MPPQPTETANNDLVPRGSPKPITISIPFDVYQNLESGQEINFALRKDWRFHVACFASGPIPPEPVDTTPTQQVHDPVTTAPTPQAQEPVNTIPMPQAPLALPIPLPATASPKRKRTISFAIPVNYRNLFPVMPQHPCLVYPLPPGIVAPWHPLFASRGAHKRFFVIIRGLAVGVFYGLWAVVSSLVINIPGACWIKIRHLSDAKLYFDQNYPEQIEILSKT